MNQICIIFRRIKRGIKHNLDVIGSVILLFSPFVQLYFERQIYGVITGLLFVSTGMSFISLDSFVNNKKSCIPVMRKRFVRYEKSTNKVSMNEDDLQEAMNYLIDLQEYFERRGML